MTRLAPFQDATVKAAEACLRGPGARRFLVADEVGLGKTMIARETAARLKGRRTRFNILYLCPSLEIAGQNRSKFISLTGLDEKDYMAGEDRLSLVPLAPPALENGFRIFSFTPETSLPGWKPGPRTGRKAEREVIRTLISAYPSLEAQLDALDDGRGAASPLLPAQGTDLDGYDLGLLQRALRDVFFIRGPTEQGLLDWLSRSGNGLAEFISRARAALALAALRSPELKPDFVVLDEFHRYADLILPREPDSTSPTALERARVHALMSDALLGGRRPPAVMLLSATPYRLRRLSGEDVHPVEHYRALIDLAGFLTGSAEVKDRVEAAMRAYQDALHAPGGAQAVVAAVRSAKTALESLLRPVVARTERALVHEADLFDRPFVPVAPDVRDLQVFRHFAGTVQRAPARLRGWAPAMWSSIPYPAQTLHGYALWKSVAGGGRPPIEAGGKGQFAHPQLRALAKIAGDPKALVLPWQRPTSPWWSLEGAWSASKPHPGKTLLFSRWRGAPTAVSALLSLQIAGPPRAAGVKAPPGYLRPGGGDASALIGLFAPWPLLSGMVDPIPQGSETLAAVRKRARADLEAALVGRVKFGGSQKRPVWHVALGLEHHLSRPGFKRLATAVASASTGTGTRRWDRAEKIGEISQAELSALAAHLLCAPGAVTARCAARHGIALDNPKAMKACFSFTWNALRAYLGHRPFAAAILPESGCKRYPDALCKAVLKGGFEAVLDEQMTVLSVLGEAKDLKIFEGLDASLVRRPGLVRLRRGRRDARVPVQAIMPFSGGEQKAPKSKKAGKLRSESLRKAFNSPFWPHILCTTSAGQEGLDFHLWCARLVHWDLPSDPVDFEQREGRIARYASLAVRQSLAQHHGAEALAGAGQDSPSRRLLEIARSQPSTETGLERWWLPANGRPESISFDWKFSQRSERKDRMLKDLLYYRLALGQPDTSAFAAMLKRIGADAQLARSLAINLAPIATFSPCRS